MFEITYRLLGEIQDSVVTLQGLDPASSEAEQIHEVVSVDGLLFDRGDFHGKGIVLVSDVSLVEYA